jgi:hypothetical protein
VYYISSLSSKSLKLQSDQVIKEDAENYYLNPKNNDVSPKAFPKEPIIWHLDDLKKTKYQSNFDKIFKDLEVKKTVLLINDECHWAQLTDGTWRNFLRKLGIDPLNLTETDRNKWPKNLFLLSISATPFLHASKKIIYPPLFGDAELEVTDEYFGVKSLLKSARLNDNDGIRLSDNDYAYLKTVLLPKVEQQFEIKKETGVVVVRVERGKTEQLKQEIENYFANSNKKIKINCYGTKHEDIFNAKKLIETPSYRLKQQDVDIIFALIINAFSAGDDIELQNGNVLGWYETNACDEKVDTTIQRVGRCFGYKGKKDLSFPIFVSKKVLEEADKFYDGKLEDNGLPYIPKGIGLTKPKYEDDYELQVFDTELEAQQKYLQVHGKKWNQTRSTGTTQGFAKEILNSKASHGREYWYIKFSPIQYRVVFGDWNEIPNELKIQQANTGTAKPTISGAWKNDVASYLLKGTKQTFGGEQFFWYIDGPSNAHLQSWEGIKQFKGKYAWFEPLSQQNIVFSPLNQCDPACYDDCRELYESSFAEQLGGLEGKYGVYVKKAKKRFVPPTVVEKYL